MEQSRTRWLSQVFEHREGQTRNQKRKDCGKIEKVEDFCMLTNNKFKYC
jgi:hypothetical protein